MPRVSDDLRKWAEKQNIDPQNVVLSSGSSKANKNLGNVKYNNAIKMSAPEYAGTKNKKMRMNIIRQIVDGSSFSFVKEKDGEYQFLKKTVAYDKVSHALRTQVKNLEKKSTNLPTTTSSAAIRTRRMSEASEVSIDSFKNDIRKIEKKNWNLIRFCCYFLT